MTKITNLSSYHVAISEFVTELIPTYMSGDINDLEVLLNAYRALRHEAEDNGVCTDDTTDKIGAAISSIVKLGADQSNKVELFFRHFPATCQTISILDAHESLANFRHYFCARLKNSNDPSDYINCLSAAIQIVSRAKNVEFVFAFIDDFLDEFENKNTSIDPSPAGIGVAAKVIRPGLTPFDGMGDAPVDYTISAIVKILESVEHASVSEVEVIAKRVSHLIDVVVKYKPNVRIKLVDLMYLLSNNFKGIGIEFFNKINISYCKGGDLVGLYEVFGLTYSKERMINVMESYRARADVGDIGLSLARIKIILGHDDDYAPFFSGYSPKAADIRATISGLEKANLPALKAFAEGLFMGMESENTEGREEILGWLNTLPDGSEVIGHLKSSRRTGRKFLELELGM